MSVGQEFWLAAASTPEGGETYLKQLRSKMAAADMFELCVPSGNQGLQFGSFDNLIRLMDDLQKYDQQTESVVHRLERQSIEVDPNVTFKVMSQRQEKTFLEYLRTWAWDEAKYPKSRNITDNMALLVKTVGQFDDETRNMTQKFNDMKVQRSAIAKKDQALLTAKDLIDVFTPAVVNANDFVYSEYLTTLVVILPKGANIDFVKCYETLAENVVPSSAKQFKELDDKEGNMLWRIVCFRSSLESVKKAIREKRWLVRDFEYSEPAYEALVRQRETVEKDVAKGLAMIKGLYAAAWSDSMVAWMHVKATRVFVESVLRFGMPCTFASFCVSPPAGKGAAMRKALGDVLGGGAGAASAGADDEEEMFPYVSISMIPFVVTR